MSKSVAIYARVSTDRQTTDSQLHELGDFVRRAKWKVYREYIDNGYSGKNTQRPAYTEMLSDARHRRFDLLVIWKLDRLSRSFKDLVTTLDELGHLGIDFISYDNKLDTSSPSGKLVFNIIGAVAEFERDIIRERVRAGLVNARRRGKMGTDSTKMSVDSGLLYWVVLAYVLKKFEVNGRRVHHALLVFGGQ